MVLWLLAVKLNDSFLATAAGNDRGNLAVRH